MNLQPKIVKPEVARALTSSGWGVWCECTPLGLLDWGSNAQFAATQSEAFNKALTHARREHWTPEVAQP